MKLWIRYFVGTAIGIALGVIVPASGGDTLTVLTDITDILVRVGRFLLFPIAFFAMIIAVDELRDDRRVFSVTWRFVAVTVGTVVASVVIAFAAITVFQPQRVPPMVQESAVVTPPSVMSLLSTGIPYNGFRLFTSEYGAYGILLVFAIFIGGTLRFDREITSPVSLVADSVNRILYRLNRHLTSFLGFLLAIPAGMVIVQLRLTDDLALFTQFLIVVTTIAVFIGMIVYPVTIYLIGKDHRRAFGWISGMAAPGLAALTTGDVYFATPTLARCAKETFGIPRRIGGSVLYLSAVFNRAGSALVAVAGFLLVVRSYTALEIGFAETLVVIATGILSSFILGRTPSGAVVLLLSYLAIAYGRGMEESYLILLPVVPLLERIGAWLDVMTHGFVTFFLADLEGIGADEPRRV